ncbi:ABC transporter substrate-binding protein [Undibacterium sp. FT31W]|uniref:ABC transporter substrate-binding protein n=2 Tax=Undibacterium griseum TaxID=2762295 RepID=A0ABR6YMS5_9BURK|nr:ABC transporter substrate-binding protein [Undibacterium griseum]
MLSRMRLSTLVLMLIAVLLPLRVMAMSVIFLNPGKHDEIYWQTAANSMSAAAKNLGIDLEIMYAERNHLRALEFARQIAARPAAQRPDYVILSNDYSTGLEVIRTLDTANIKTFLAFSGMHDTADKVPMPQPRQQFKGWLGSLEPRATDAGYLTARALFERGMAEHLAAPDGKLHMLVIAGDRSTPTSLRRNEGMRQAVAEAKNVVIDQEIYGEWNRAKAREQSEWLYKRHPQARLIWAGNDLMAFGAMDSWRAQGGKPGTDALFSGINTSQEAIAAVEDGSMTALAGGHFIAGAFGLVMLYDYHHGRDFIDEGLELNRPMFILLNKEEARHFQMLFGQMNFDKVNFRKFSKVLNPLLKKYDFSFRQLLIQTPQAVSRK